MQRERRRAFDASFREIAARNFGIDELFDGTSDDRVSTFLMSTAAEEEGDGMRGEQFRGKGIFVGARGGAWRRDAPRAVTARTNASDL